MKTALLLALVFCFAPIARADEKEGNFETHKAEMLKNIDEHIAKLQEHRTCVSSAASGDALKACRETMKEYRFDKKMEHMENRKGRMDKRMKRAKERHDEQGGQ